MGASRPPTHWAQHRGGPSSPAVGSRPYGATMWRDSDGEDSLEAWRAGWDPHHHVEEDGDVVCGFGLEPFPCSDSRDS